METFWTNKKILITGASSGIGAALALEITRRGGFCVLLARRADLLKNLKEKIEAQGGRAECFVCDVRDEAAVGKIVETVDQNFGAIDILIANAGVGGNNAETRNLKPSAVREVIDVNLLGAVNAVSAVLPGMLERGSGQLVAVSSLAGFRGLPKSAAYCASKAGMTTFFESVRLDIQKRGVKVTIIQPGFIKTPLTSGRENKMPFVLELEDSVPYFLDAVERQKKFAAFPWQLAAIVRLGRIFPAWLYDRIAGAAKYRE